MSVVIEPTGPMPPEEIIRQLKALREHIPDFVQLSRSDVQALTRSAGVDPRLIHTTLSAAVESGTLRGNLDRSPEELREEAEVTSRLEDVAEELSVMLKGVRGGDRRPPSPPRPDGAAGVQHRQAARAAEGACRPAALRGLDPAAQQVRPQAGEAGRSGTAAARVETRAAAGTAAAIAVQTAVGGRFRLPQIDSSLSAGARAQRRAES